MKAGKRVWFMRKGNDGKARHVEATIVEFGKGTTATLKLPDGREVEVEKARLLAKNPHRGPTVEA